MQRQQRGVKLDHAVLRDRAEFGRREQQHIGHDADIGVAFLQRGERFRGGIFGKAEDRKLPLLRCDNQRVGPRARLFRRGEDAGDRVAARDKGLQHGFAESLLTDDDDAHIAS